MIKASIIGSTGYVGNELLRILYTHPQVTITHLGSKSYSGTDYSEVYESYRHTEYVCGEDDLYEAAEKSDVVFLALPHGLASSRVNKVILSKVKIIDLGADYRLSDYKVYEKWYDTKHESINLLSVAVYGLPEIYKDDVKRTRLLANPGCYTTCSILSLYPLLKEGIIDPKSIIIDAKSGVSGAGRGTGLGTHYCETNENIKAYKLGSHRHTPEIEEQLSKANGGELFVSFTPHLTPMNRGILTTAYGSLCNNYTYEQIKSVYESYYKQEPFVRLTKKDVFPETKWTKGSNYIDIGFCIDERTNRIVVVGALDNLIKGASGQAIQNMNIMFDLPEDTGLKSIPVFPA